MQYNRSEIADAVRRGLEAARDRPQPDDVYRSPDKYAKLGGDFQLSAWRHLNEDGDLPQASNKAWGLVAETVKAVSAQHGSIIHGHRSIWLVIRELNQLIGDAGNTETQAWIANAFGRARSLHANFYEDEESATEVAAGLVLCEELSDRLYELFWPDRPQGDATTDLEVNR